MSKVQMNEVQDTKKAKRVGESMSQDATLEDALLALSKIPDEEPIDSSDPPPEEDGEEDEVEIDLDSFLEINRDEDKNTPPRPKPASPEPASPEIEDIMERISKQALSHND